MNKKWWKEAIIYQIYPRSFMDSNGDGVGDLQGIISRLDYLKNLGVDIVWLSPVYKSPQDDNGYDISDYCAIFPQFGTMADFDELLHGVHRRGMKLIMDLVVNHTSDEHPWFIESRSSKDNPKRDWYIWLPPRNGKEPNNWWAFFATPAWELDTSTGEYYLHLFSRKQPDLNWNNTDMRKAVYSMMRWWLDKGIDGFRMDVINLLAKAPGLPDAPPQREGWPYAFGGELYANQPGMHEILQEMNREVLSKYDCMSVGECLWCSPENSVAYAAEARQELDMLFQFDITYARRNVAQIKDRVLTWYSSFKGKAWNTITLNNHDTPRQVSAFGNDKEYLEQSAKALALFILTAPGTPYLFQGEELGMTNVVFATIDDYRDIQILNQFREGIADGRTPQEILAQFGPTSRDNARTPMQWSSAMHAGFTKGIPWMKVNPNYQSINAAQQLQDPDSVLAFYRTMIQARKENDALVYGDYLPLDISNDLVIAYTRECDSTGFLTIINFSTKQQTFALPAQFADRLATLAMTNYTKKNSTVESEGTLDPWEARLYELVPVEVPAAVVQEG
jgi:oligo-1,6-glucosidase